MTRFVKLKVKYKNYLKMLDKPFQGGIIIVSYKKEVIIFNDKI